MRGYHHKVVGFWRRWNVPLDQRDEFQRFKNRVLVAVDRTVGEYLLAHPGTASRFAIITGAPYAPRARFSPLRPASHLLSAFQSRTFDESPVFEGLSAAGKVDELLFYLQCLFWALEEAKCPHLHALVTAIRAAIDASPLVHVRLVCQGHRVTLYPAGARLLDDGLVNEVLEWLVDHRPVAIEFEKALSKFLKKEHSEYRNLVDDLRLGLEKLLRRTLHNRRRLEKQREPLGRWLKSKGAHEHVRNMYDTLLAHFCKYQNEAVKHKAEHPLTEADVEFMIYLTGAFMRFVLRLNAEQER